MVKWKLRKYLDENEVSAYALTKAAALAPNTVYALARGDQSRVDLEVLDKVIAGLERLTGRPVGFDDLLEREVRDDTDDQTDLLATGTAGLAEALDDLEQGIPPEELKAWLDAFEQDRA